MYRLIVIDDDVDAVNTISKDFPWEQYGFSRVASFQDGKSALEWLRSHTVDLILCDIKMPQMNGIELARQLHSMHRREKIIFISGYKDFEYARKALEYGVRSYCIKPVTFREMQKTIQTIREELESEYGSLPSGGENAPEGTPMSKSRSLSDVKIERIRRYIGEYYASVTLNQLAEYLQMNTTYLSHYFKEKTGEKLFDYITEVRLNAALELLKTGNSLNVSEVAEKVGYKNAISFSRSFKKQFGMPPSEAQKGSGVTEVKR